MTGPPSSTDMTKTMTQLPKRPYHPRPEFLSGVIAEPTLLFGGNHEHIDPKTGLALYGPYCPPGLSRPALSSMIVGVVGPPAMVADAAAWLEGCKNVITNSGEQPYLYPHFPGCRPSEAPYFCELISQPQWHDTIRDVDLKRALAKPIFEERLAAVIDLYVAGIETLSQREPAPSVVLICLPQEVVDSCAHAARGSLRVRRSCAFLGLASRAGNLISGPYWTVNPKPRKKRQFIEICAGALRRVQCDGACRRKLCGLARCVLHRKGRGAPAAVRMQRRAHGISLRLFTTNQAACPGGCNISTRACAS